MTSSVLGIGGVFLFADDLKTLVDWYAHHLGLTFACYAEGQCYGLEFPYTDPDGRPAHTVFSLNKAAEPLGPGRRQATINWRVADLDGFLAGLEAAGVAIEKREDYDFGRFAWVTDPEGNRLELYQMA
jgi:predicted enzyme related to lactoylglutathione lyase